MTREELNKMVNLNDKIESHLKFSGEIELRNHIELRLISDSLRDISNSLKLLNNQMKSEDLNGDTEYLVDSIVNLRNALIKK